MVLPTERAVYPGIAFLVHAEVGAGTAPGGHDLPDMRGDSLSAGRCPRSFRAVDSASSGRGAAHDFYFDPSRPWLSPTAAHYAREELLAPRWAETTLCGKAWAVMVGGEGGPLREDGEAPSGRHADWVVSWEAWDVD
ncbi:hypothetical protein [Frankia sp. EAN1pec]|uniref:hypothetical protein n=1 Tax=Parafrankia sp. (strain EAN1pec) TaxID=298653 RepID=UPI00059EB4C4